jgi:hypothetical protein
MGSRRSPGDLVEMRGNRFDIRDLSLNDPPVGIGPGIDSRRTALAARGWTVAHSWQRMGGSSWLDCVLYDSGSRTDVDFDPLASEDEGSQRGNPSPPSLQSWPSRSAT